MNADAPASLFEQYGETAFGLFAVIVLIVVITKAALVVWDRIIEPMMTEAREQAAIHERNLEKVQTIATSLEATSRALASAAEANRDTVAFIVEHKPDTLPISTGRRAPGAGSGGK